MDFLGLHNVLALRGDKRQNEPRFVPYAQGHAHAADLVRQIQAMNRGEFIDGEVEECHHSKFSVGVAGLSRKAFRGGERPKRPPVPQGEGRCGSRLHS